MAEIEPERLLLQLHELMERRARLRDVLQSRLQQVLLQSDRQDIEKVIRAIDADIAEIQGRLESLRGSGGELA